MAEPSNTEKFANSVALVLVSRIAMVLAAGALPVAGTLMSRTLDNIQKVSDKVDLLRDELKDNAAAIRLLQQTQQVQSGFIADHEARVRVLESHVKFLDAKP